VFCDNDVSAYTGKARPQYLKMLELLHSGGTDVVLVWHTDRLHRSNIELEDYINVVEIDGVTVIPEEAAAIMGMADAVLSGVPLRSIGRDLRGLGVPTASGAEWTPGGVRAVLIRPRNAGFMVHRETVRKRRVYTDDDIVDRAPWAPVLDEEVWRSVVAKLTDPERRTNYAGPAPRWLGSGVYRCPCGSAMRVNKSGADADRPIYRCQASGKGHVSIPVAPVDKLVEKVVVEKLSRPDAADLITAPGKSIDVAGLRAELATCRARLEEIAADYNDDKITRTQFLTQTERRRAKMARIEEQLAEATEVSPLSPLIGAQDPSDPPPPCPPQPERPRADNMRSPCQQRVWCGRELALAGPPCRRRHVIGRRASRPGRPGQTSGWDGGSLGR